MSRFAPIAIALLLRATSAIAAGPANPDPAAVTAGSFAVEPSHTRVQFTVSHMGFTNWYGDFTGASGSLRIDPKNIAASTVEISIPTASVSTTNTILDGELKSADWFDAAQFPTIRFVSTAVKPTGPNTADITGNLSFHGVTRPVVLVARFNGAGINPIDKAYTLGFDATTTIKRSDWGVKNYVPVIGDETILRISAAFETPRKAR
ncbi:YceI family protein [Sandarakinorhabdus sp.]|uniref:YceI family protein n=1 Tax=Sandarakinorhabdus sp. TaxID=1916663 RepID=UPI00333FDCC0